MGSLLVLSFFRLSEIWVLGLAVLLIGVAVLFVTLMLRGVRRVRARIAMSKLVLDWQEGEA